MFFGTLPLQRILGQWLKAGYIDKETLYPTRSGTPQGGIISPLLANMTLDGLEQAILDSVPKRGAKVNVIRYADDFIVTAQAKETLEEKVQPAIARFLAERGLRLSTEKTAITPIGKGLDFLGQTLRKFGQKLLITPAKRNVKALLEKVRAVLKRCRQVPAEVLISRLNPLIRGWANYHRHIVAKATCTRVDYLLSWALWRWAKRRHPNKAGGWIRKKYFLAAGGGFCATVTAQDGTRRLRRLYRAASTVIQRHIKVKADANPFDPRYTDYFERRRVFAWRVYTPRNAVQTARR